MGITKAHNREELNTAIDTALREDDKVVFEEFIDGQEVECAAIGNPDNPQEVASMTDEKKQLLKDIFWEMNEISYETEEKVAEKMAANIDTYWKPFAAFDKTTISQSVSLSLKLSARRCCACSTARFRTV